MPQHAIATPLQAEPAAPTVPVEQLSRGIAGAVSALTFAALEFNNGGPQLASMKSATVDALTQLVLWRAAAGDPVAFDMAARECGLKLIEQCDARAGSTLTAMLDEVLRLVGRIAKTQWH